MLFPIPVEFCVLDWILMVQALYFLLHSHSVCNKHLATWSLYVHGKGSILPHVLRKIASEVWVIQKFPYVTALLNTTIQLCDFTSVIIKEGTARTLLPLLGNPDWEGGKLSHLECSLTMNPCNSGGQEAPQMRVCSKCRLSHQGQREMGTASGKSHTVKGPKAVHQHIWMYREHTTPTSAFELSNVGKSLSFKDSHFHLIRFCSFPLVTERDSWGLIKI